MAVRTSTMRPGGGELSVFLVYDVAAGAYHHYCVSLANALVMREEVRDLCLVTFFPAASGRDESGAFAIHDRVRRVRLCPVGGSRIRRARRMAGASLRLLGEARRKGSLVHWHTTSGNVWLDTGFLIACRLAGVPVVRTVHEVTAAEQSRPPGMLDRALAWLHLRLARAVIVHDSAARSRIRAAYPGAVRRLAVIPHGNYLGFRQLAAATPGATAEPPAAGGGQARILFHGVKRNKGLEVFVQALGLLAREGVKIRPRVVGPVAPGDEDLLALLADIEGLERRPGYLPAAALAAEYAGADIVVFPYLRGTTSGAVHVAMAFERACVVSDLPCFRGVLEGEREALFVPPGDPVALAAAIHRLVADPALRRRLGRAAGRRERDPALSWERIAGDTVALYRRALAACGRPATPARDPDRLP